MSTTHPSDSVDAPTEAAATAAPAVPEPPQAVRVVDIDPETKEFRADKAALAAILEDAAVVDLPVVVVSVAGPFRKG